MRRCNLTLAGLVVLITSLTAALPTATAAQDPDGFLFRAPNLTLTARVGYAVPTLQDDLFNLTTRQLTLGRSDFNAPLIGGELAVRVSRRVDLTVGAGHAGVTRVSEFRDWVGEDDLPIVQDTRFSRSYLTAGAKLFLSDRGRTAGTFAWVPEALAPYVSIAAGGAWYAFEQEGEFVDFETSEIFIDRFSTRGEGFTAQAALGLDVSLGARFFLNGEGRYGWANANLGPDFEGFDHIDLSGFQATVGIGIRL